MGIAVHFTVLCGFDSSTHIRGAYSREFFTAREAVEGCLLQVWQLRWRAERGLRNA